MKKLFTSESVTEGHPDKLCDQIADAILDAIIRKNLMQELHVRCRQQRELYRLWAKFQVVRWMELMLKRLFEIQFGKLDIVTIVLDLMQI